VAGLFPGHRREVAPEDQRETIMPARFAATNNAIEKGLANATPKAATGLIDGWLAEVEKTEFTGSKGLHGDLEKLKKELEKGEPNGEAIGKLVHKLGAATTKSADKCDNERSQNSCVRWAKR